MSRRRFPASASCPIPIIRSLGVPLVTGDIPGVAVVLGRGRNGEDVAKVVRTISPRGIMTFMVGDVIEQCADAGVKMGLELRVIPLGHDVTAVIHVVTVAIRAALIFGNVQPGDLAGLLKYTKERVPAFVNTFGAIDNVVVSAAPAPSRWLPGRGRYRPRRKSGSGRAGILHRPQ